MHKKTYKYDVAYSFLKEDEELAVKINDLLQDRLSTFLYSKKQEEIAGTDGEKTFNQVFGSETRTAVVIHRKKWGKTPWTRIEETAIRNRAYEGGYDFVLFIPLDKPHQLPKWLPKTQIWYDFDRWGTEAAAAIIEEKARRAGGTPREETAIERSQRIEREAIAEKSLKQFLFSQMGVDSAREELRNLFGELTRLCDEISAKSTQLTLQTKKDARQFVIWADVSSLSVAWSQTYSDTLRLSKLHVNLCEGFATLQGQYSFEKVKILQERQFNFDRNAAGVLGWSELTGKKRFFTSAQLADECVKMILDQVRSKRLQ